MAYIQAYTSDEIYDHGIKGQRWGVRRYQNEDGSLTAAGRKRYSDMDPETYEKNIRDTLKTAQDEGEKIKYLGWKKSEENVKEAKRRSKAALFSMGISGGAGGLIAALSSIPVPAASIGAAAIGGLASTVYNKITSKSYNQKIDIIDKILEEEYSEYMKYV